MRPEVSWTTKAERDLLVAQALELLESVGMRFGPSASLRRCAPSPPRRWPVAAEGKVIEILK